MRSADVRSPSSVGEPDAAVAEGALRVLIVDDDEGVRRAYTRALARAGYVVTTAPDGQSALDALRADPFDVMVSDICMPGDTSGIELVQKARAAGMDIPVVLSTGGPSVETAMKAVEHGVLRYLAKPVDARVLIQAVGEAVRRHGLARAERLALDNGALRSLVEEMNRARDAAEAAGRAKREFLAKMSHELRTPMAAILGYTDLALDCNLPDDAREYLETARSSAGTLLGLIQNILDFAALTKCALPLQPKPFRVRDAIAAAVHPLAAEARARGVALATEIEPDVPVFVIGDPGRVRQILEMIVGNAVRFTRHGEVRVHVGLQSRDDDGVVLRVEVRDTGVGISEGALGKVGEAFCQADDSTTRLYGGAGLGLPIAAKLVELMGGTMVVESALNVGTTVGLTVSLASADV